MGVVTSPASYQRFLPTAPSRAHVWKFSWEHGGLRPRHFHAEPELNLIVRGSATFGVGEARVKVGPGDLLGFLPAQDHILLETSPDLFLFAIGMDPVFSAQVLRKAPDGVAMPLHVRLASTELTALVARAEAIVDRSGVDHLAAELWEHANWARQRGAERLDGGMHVLSRRALALMAEAPHWSRDLLARSLRTTPSAISRYFHHDIGMTLVQYRTRVRLMRFIRLFDDGMEALSTSAKAAGFGSYSQCHRAFQAELGCSPRDFFRAGVRQRMQAAYER